MKDKYNTVRGHITVECIDSTGKIVDRFENKNLIMDTARIAMAGIAAGVSTATPINAFSIGTEGHVTGDFLTPKKEVDGFVSSRNNLFSDELNSYNYTISFTPPGTTSGMCTILNEPDSGSTVHINMVNSEVEYTITIPEQSANSGNQNNISVFTEAALFAGGNIFSMKCFPAKIKESTVSLRIIWKIIF